MTRILTFEQKGKCENELQERHEKLKALLSNHSTLEVCNNKLNQWNLQDGSKHYEIKYYIQKSGRKLTWNDVYKLVNDICPVPYDFMSGRIVNGEVRARG